MGVKRNAGEFQFGRKKEKKEEGEERRRRKDRTLAEVAGILAADVSKLDRHEDPGDEGDDVRPEIHAVLRVELGSDQLGRAGMGARASGQRGPKKRKKT